MVFRPGKHLIPSLRPGIALPLLPTLMLILALAFGLVREAFGQKAKGQNQAENKIRAAENLFIDATKQELLESHKEAIDLYQKSVAEDPKNATAYFKIADILIKEGKYSAALTWSEKAISLEKGNLYFWQQVAQLQDLNGNEKAAARAYNEILERFPEQKSFRLNLAQLYIRNKNYKAAIKELNKAEKELGHGKELFQVRQRIWLQQNKLPEALSEAKRWAEAFPDDPEPRFSIAQLYFGQKKNQQAKAELDKLVKDFPHFPAAHLMLADIYIREGDEEKADKEIEFAFLSPDLPIGAKIDLLTGYLHGKLGPTDEQKALRLSEMVIKAHPQEARAFIIRGDLLNKFDHKKEARDMYIQAKAKDKNNFGLWEQLVLIDLNLNDLDSVAKHTQEARELFPNTPTFAFYNGLSNLLLKRYVEAIEALEHAKRISLDNREMQMEIYSQLGDAYHNQKEPLRSAEAFDQALLLDSNNAHVLNNYAYYLSLSKSNLAKAERMSQRLIKRYPDDPTYLDTHGWVLYQAGKFAEALKFLEKAAKNSNSGVIWEHYGDALFKNSRLNDALDAWKKAKELGGADLSTDLDQKIRNKAL